MRRIKIIHRKVGTIIAELLEKNAPKTCEAFWEILPLAHKVHTYPEGYEISFKPLPMSVELENETEIVDAGDVVYYQPWKEVCIFYGRYKCIGPVSLFAKMKGDVSSLKKVRTGDIMKIVRVTGEECWYGSS